MATALATDAQRLTLTPGIQRDTVQVIPEPLSDAHHSYPATDVIRSLLLLPRASLLNGSARQSSEWGVGAHH